jgi:signal transduction histidine kinase/tetratricopeptide (TPR) repeat protein
MLLALMGSGSLRAEGVDSLMALLPTAQGVQRIKVLNELSTQLRTDESERAQRYAEIALRLSDSLGYRPGQADSWFNLGYISWDHAELDQSEEQFSTALRLYSADHDSLGMQEALNGLGLTYDARNETEQALNHYTEALAINQAIGHKRGESATYNNIGMMYNYQGDYSLAIEYFLKSFRLDSLMGDEDGMGLTLSNIGMIYNNTDQYDKAMVNLQRSLEIRRRLNSPSQVAKTLNNLGIVYSMLDRNEDAENAYLEALQIKRDIHNDHEVAITLNNIGMFYLDWGKTAKAQAYLEEAKRIFDTYPASEFHIDNLNLLAKYHAKAGNFERAYEFKSAASALSDSLLNQKLLSERADLMAQYETEVKERELEQYRLEMAENKLQTSRFYLALTLLGAGMILLMAVALVIFIGYRRKARSNNDLKELNDAIAAKNTEIEAQKNQLEWQNKQIKEINSNLELLVEARTADLLAANEELDTFLYESSHALRRPLLRIVALFDLIRQEKDPAVVEELNTKVETTVRAMNNTFRKLVEVNEISHRTAQADGVKFSELVPSLLRELGEQYRPSEMEVVIESRNDDSLTTDRYIFSAILRNLIDNALHFNRIAQGVKHKVVVSLEHESRGIRLSVRDNGTGIPARLHENIFQMFFRGTERSAGSGLGLFVVKKGVEKLHGTMEVKSVENEGTEMIIRLPYPEKTT